MELIKRNENILKLIEEIKELEQEMLEDKLKFSKKKNELIEKIKEKMEKNSKEYEIEEEYWNGEKINIFSIEKELKMKKEIFDSNFEEKEIEENIIKISGMSIKEEIFHSDQNKWEINNSEFCEKLNGKRNIIIVIKDTEGNIFGGYISTDMIENKYLFDNNGYLFSIKKNGEITNKKYSIKNNEYSFTIETDNSPGLFSFGGEDKGNKNYFKDICIYKKDYKSKNNFCKQHSYEYYGEENALIGKQEFEIKKIIVYEMEETVEMKKKREIQEKEEIMKKRHLKKEEERKIKEEIEKYTNMEIDDVIFDSNIHKWNKSDSEFSTLLNNKSKVIILIEDQNGNIFGGYTEKEIKIEKWINKRTFLFSIKKNNTIKMKIYLLKPNENGFYLHKNHSLFLFGFGLERNSYKDICVHKKDIKYNDSCEQYSFEYNEKEHCLSDKNYFDVERILVYQLE